MSTVHILKGLPGSGKSTYAKQLCEAPNWKRVNKDDLRGMIDHGVWNKSNERMITAIRDLIIVEALSAGLNVVVDDTNFEQKHIDNITTLTESFKPTIEVKFFDTPVEECIKRDLVRPNSCGSKVIMDMYNRYLMPTPEPPAIDHTLPWAVICDIDGTLAHMSGRSPFDPTRYHTDTLDNTVAKLVHDQRELGNRIIICSGRSNDNRAETEQWLSKYKIRYDELLMRPGNDDNRNDSVVKREIYDQEIAGKYNVRFVLDDRDRVVKMWRQAGLKCLQVEYGDF